MQGTQKYCMLLYNNLGLPVCSYRVFDLHPPVKEFRISIVIQEVDYTRTDGTEVWVNRATLEVGPHRTVVKSNTLTVRTHHTHIMWMVVRWMFKYKRKSLSNYCMCNIMYACVHELTCSYMHNVLHR